MRKFVLIILGIVYLFFFGIFDVKADDVGAISSVTSYSMFGAENFNVNQWGSGVSGGAGTWANWGKGYLIFSVATYCKHQETPGSSCASYVSNMLTGINVNVDSKNYTCDIGNSNSYFNNGDSVNTYSAKCLIDRTSNGKFTIGFSYPYSPSNFTVRFSDNITFVQITSSTSTITDAISSNSQAERTLLTNIINSLNAGNNNVEQAINQGNQNTEDIKNAINDSSIDSGSSTSINNFSSSMNSSFASTPVSNLVSMPITFLTGVNNALSTSCTNVNYITLFNYQLVLPCLNLSERLGSVWVIIDTICSAMLLFSIGKSLVRTFARLSDMDTNIMYECYENGGDHKKYD